MKKFISLLAVVMLLAMLAVPAFAAPSPSAEDVNTEIGFDPNEEPVNIEDEEVPLADLPVIAQPAAPTVEIAPEEVPLAGLPVLDTAVELETVTEVAAETVVDEATGTVSTVTEVGVETVQSAIADAIAAVEAANEAAVEAGEGTTYVPGVVLDVTTEDENVTSASVALSNDAAAAIADSGMSLTYQTNVASVKMDPALVQTIAEVEGAVTLSVEKKAADAAVQVDAEVTAVYELELTDESGNKVEFNGGSATVSVPYQGDAAYAGCVEDGEITEEYELVIDEEAGTAAWTTPHFSTWALYKESALSAPVAAAEEPASAEPERSVIEENAVPLISGPAEMLPASSESSSGISTGGAIAIAGGVGLAGVAIGIIAGAHRKKENKN